MTSTQIHNIKQKSKSVFNYIILYLKNPLVAMRTVPEWPLHKTLLIQIIFSFLIGLTSDFISDFVIVRGTYFFPISSVITTLLGSGFFYFLFLVLFEKEVEFKKLYIIVFLSHVPFLFLRLFKIWISPIELIGFMATSALLAVGFVENFQFPKKKVLKIIGILFSVYLVIWIAQQISSSKKTIDSRKHLQNQIEEDTVEKLKNELSF